MLCRGEPTFLAVMAAPLASLADADLWESQNVSMHVASHTRNFPPVHGT